MTPDYNNYHVERPPRPDLRCTEHESLCNVIHSLHSRVVALEQRVQQLERECVVRHKP